MLFHTTNFGSMILGDSLKVLHDQVEPGSVDLVVTSPPFGLIHKKSYGNVSSDKYLDWFRPFGEAFRRVLKPNGSLVIDIGGSWVPGQPTRSLYHFKLLIMLCEEFGFHLAQEYYWWNPAKLPSPAEWVTIRRIRVKDAVNCIWWLSPTPYPRASNRRVLQPYRDGMERLLKSGYQPKLRPSGHDISKKFSRNNGAAIPPNLIALANTDSNGPYLRYCRERGITPHPARFPTDIPEYFVRMLTDVGDTVIDPFGGSCTTGEVCERLRRRWICIDLFEEHLTGALGRFTEDGSSVSRTKSKTSTDSYKIARPGVLWDDENDEPLDQSGGLYRAQRPSLQD